MTITISNQVESSKFEKLLKFLYQERIAFSFEPSPSASEDDLAVQERLRDKYVASGQWATMNPDEKEDAAILEKMLYLEETGQTSPLNAEENTDFANEMKSWL